MRATIGLLAAAVLTGAFLVVLCQDGKRSPIDAANFEQWFVGTGDSIPAEILRSGAWRLDSIVDVIRRASPVGRVRTVLRDTAGNDYSLGYLTPDVIRHDTTYPCVIYIHGGTGSQRRDKGDSAYLMLDMLADSMDLFLASPSADRNTPWWSAAGLSRILQTLRYMSLHYPINPRKVFLAGVSDGATGCWAAANTIGAPFAAFIAVSGFGGMLPQLGMRLFPENLMQRPIYNVNAGNDRLYPIAAVNRFLDLMEQSGVRVHRMVYPEEQHGFDYRLKEAPNLCRILREWSLPASTGFLYKGCDSYPWAIEHCISLERAVDTAFFSLHGYCRSDTFFIYSAGLRRLRMYFDADNPCVAHGVFLINNKKYRIKKESSFDIKTKFLLMKQRCFPIMMDYSFFFLKLQ